MSERFPDFERFADEVARLRGRMRALFADTRAVSGLPEMELTVLTAVVNAATPPTVAQIQMLLARMSAAMRRGEVLAVHCLAGLGRTGTVLAAWLVREGLTAEEALRRVRLIDAQYVQSEAQEALLYEYENALLLKMG